MYVDISKLTINPNHQTVYKALEIDGLVEKIRDFGQLEPIVVNEKYVIISGVRRYYALKKLGIMQALVEIRKVDVADELSTIIAFNEQRQKTASELLLEAKYYKQAWAKKRGRKAEKDRKPNDSKPVDTRAKVAQKVGISTGNLSKLEYIENNKKDLLDSIDKGDITINQAYNALKKVVNQKTAVDFESTAPKNISTADFKIYNKSSDDLSDLDDGVIQTIFTSPPYWGKRKYTSSSDELGAEKTSEEYVQRMAAHLHNCYRVLNDKGSMFLNLGDTFHDKCLQSIPHRVVIELVKRKWILRNTIIWKKTNPLPSSVDDNLTPSYEYIFHLVKFKDYDYHRILIPAKTTTKAVTIINQKGKNGSSLIPSICINGLKKGKNIEDYWTQDIVTTATANQAAVVKYGGTDHPAPFPTEIITLPILLTSKPTDYVMDPFSGSGSTGTIALLLGRRYIGYDINPNYSDMQSLRLQASVDTYNELNKPQKKVTPQPDSTEAKQAA